MVKILDMWKKVRILQSVRKEDMNKYYPKNKIRDYSPLFPMLRNKYNDGGKQISMMQAMAAGKVTREQVRGEELLLVG